MCHLPFVRETLVVFLFVTTIKGFNPLEKDDCEISEAEELLDAIGNLFIEARVKLSKAHLDFHTHGPTCGRLPVDCSEVIAINGLAPSGTYRVYPRSRVLANSTGFDVYCDMETDGGGWTVIQRRGDFGADQENFYRDWDTYRHGFGDLEKEFWFGNDKIYALTNQDDYSIRFDLEGENGDRREAVYDSFWIDCESRDYELHVGEYSGNAGDSFTIHDGMKFSTIDKDNDDSPGNCARTRKGGWWYKSCASANMNGANLRGKYDHKGASKGIVWKTWMGSDYSLLMTEIKIRPGVYEHRV